jgi:hypothetical protein
VRIHRYLAALGLALALAAPASAQLLGFFTPVGQVQNVPVSTEGWNAPIAAPMTAPGPSALTQYIPGWSTFSNMHIIGQSTFPTGNQLPGLTYLKAFGYRQGLPLNP